MKQVILALTTIITVASLAVVGTFAYFSDSESSQGNSLQTGSLDLQLGDTFPYPGVSPPYTWDEDYGDDPDSVTKTWDYELGYPQSMIPRDTLASMVKLQNIGTIAGASLDIICANHNTAPPGGPPDKDAKMIISVLVYHNSTSLDLLDNPDPQQRVDDVDGDGKVTLHDWESDPILGLTPPPLGSEAFLEMTVLFGPCNFDPIGTPGSYQGCETNMTLIFALSQ